MRKLVWWTSAKGTPGSVLWRLLPSLDRAKRQFDQKKVPISRPVSHLLPISSERLPPSLLNMLPRGERRPLTTDDLMHRQELGTDKRQKRTRDEDGENSQDFDEPNSGEDSSALNEDEDDQESMSDILIQDEEDAVPSRFSFKPRQATVSKESTTPLHAPSPPQTFGELGASSSLVAAMNKMSIHTPTEIQIACIPPILDGMYFSYLVFPLHADDFCKVGIV